MVTYKTLFSSPLTNLEKTTVQRNKSEMEIQSIRNIKLALQKIDAVNQGRCTSLLIKNLIRF